MLWLYRSIDTVAVFAAALVAALALSLPIDFGWSSNASALQLNTLAISLPRATAMGVLVAVVVAVVAMAAGRATMAWVLALSGAVGMLFNHTVGRSNSAGISPATLNFIDAIAAGLLLGGAAVAIRGRRLPVLAWTAGLLTGATLALAYPGARNHAAAQGVVRSGTQGLETPPLWLIIGVVGLLSAGALAARLLHVAWREPIELPIAPIAGAVQLILIRLAAAEWLNRHDAGLAAGLVAIAITAGSAYLAAILFPRRDGELILLVVAVTACGSSVAPVGISSAATVPIVICGSAGLFLGIRWPAPAAALAVPAALAAIAAATAPNAHGVLVVGGFTVLTAIIGYCFGAAAPRYRPTWVLAGGVLLEPAVVLALREHVNGPHLLELAQANGRWRLYPPTAEHAATPAIAALFAIAGSLLGLLLLRRRRPIHPDNVGIPADNRTEQD